MKGIGKKGWTRISLGEVCRNVNETIRNPAESDIERYIGLEHIEPGNLHILTWGSVSDGTTFTKRFTAGQVLFGKRRAYQKKSAVADFDGICSGDILVLEANEKVIDKNLFPFLISSDRFFDYAVQTSAGSLSPRTKFQDLAKFEFFLPPREQQAKLAELLWAADEVCENYFELSKKTKFALRVLLQDAFDKPESFFYDYKTVKLSECCMLQTGLAKGKKYLPNEKTKNVPYLRVANVQDGHLDLNEIKEIEVREKDINRFLLRHGDVLITEGGDFDKVGRGTIWEGQIDPCLHQNHLFSLRPQKEILNSQFIAFQTMSEYGKNYFLKCAKKTSNLASINSSQVKDFPLILPSISEQNELVAKVSMLQQNISKLEKNKTEVSDIKRDVINKIFSN